MASTASDTGDTSSKQQQAQRKEKCNNSKKPASSVDHCHPYRRKEKQSTKPTRVTVYLFWDLSHVRACVCHNEKNVPGEWQARQAI